MKKVRVNLRRGVKSWSFVLYDSAESAFFLRNEPASDTDTFDMEYRRVVRLNAGDVAEVEWVGGEWVYDDEVDFKASGPLRTNSEKFDKVRIGKLSVLKSTRRRAQKTGFLEVYSGWVPHGDVPWSQETASDDVRITPIKGKMQPKIDFSQLFPGDDLEEEDQDVEPSEASTPKETVLN